MSRARDLAALERLSGLVLDHRLSRLNAAAARMERSRMQIAALDRPAEPEGISAVTAGQVGLRYRLWADARKGELNTVLARQTVEWIEARQDAREAFGRLEALRGVAARLGRK